MRTQAIYLALAIVLLCPDAAAQFVQQGGKLVGTAAVGNAYQGYSVSLSADGNTAIVGAYGDNNFAGAAWVYTRSGAVWTQQGNKLVGTGAVGIFPYQGSSVSLSADGNTAIVGGLGDSSGVGAAWVFTRAGGIWTQQGSKLVGTGAVSGINGVRQGTSVSLSSDGNTAIVGGWGDNSSAGAAWVFTRSGSVWTQQGSKLVGTGAVNSSNGAWQGYSVSVSSDGNTALVGGLFDNDGVGAAWVYTRTGSVWTQQGNKLVGTGAVGSAEQGTSVSLSSNGNTAIVGGFADSNAAGAAWVYTRTGGVWSQEGSKLVGTGAVNGFIGASQGTSVSLSADGNTAIAGGPNDNSAAGAVWVYTRSGGVWTQLGSKLVGTDSVGNARQGNSVSLSSDGNTAIVGGRDDNGSAGAAWVFTRGASSVWGQSEEVPRQSGLAQNYPNPFNPSTTIKFELLKTAGVKLSVFDILGREVSVLVNERKDAGVHEVKFDGSNLASGVYFYRLQAGDFVQTKRLLLLK
jgi:hypothetical protein